MYTNIRLGLGVSLALPSCFLIKLCRMKSLEIAIQHYSSVSSSSFTLLAGIVTRGQVPSRYLVFARTGIWVSLAKSIEDLYRFESAYGRPLSGLLFLFLCPLLSCPIFGPIFVAEETRKNVVEHGQQAGLSLYFVLELLHSYLPHCFIRIHDRRYGAYILGTQSINLKSEFK